MTLHDIYRKHIEQIVAYARTKVSSETGFLQAHPNGELVETSLIPVWENLLYVYALFKTRTLENAQAARSHLKKILAFQIEKGTSHELFPVVLTDYPFAHDRFEQIEIYFLFRLMLKDEETNLGSELVHLVSEAAARLEQAILLFLDEVPLVLKAVFNLSTGRVLNEDVINILQNLSNISEKNLGLFLLALFHFHKDVFIFEPYVKAIMNLWAPNVLQYRLLEPQVNTFSGIQSKSLLDWVMIALYGVTEIVLSKDRLYLESLLVPSIPKQDVEVALDIESATWRSRIGPHWMWSISTWNPPSHAVGVFSPFTLYYKNFSLVLSCPRASVRNIDCEEGILLELVPYADTYTFEKESQPLFSFFWNYGSKNTFLIDEMKANTLLPGSKISVGAHGDGFELSYTIASGDVFGHVVRGNRPQELNIKGANRFKSYDWMLTVRPLRVPVPDVIRIHIRPL